jgi:hypothetical protein
VKKNVLCEKGDEITRFDGTYNLRLLSWKNKGLKINGKFFSD